MNLSVLTLLERIGLASPKDQEADWFACGVAAHQKRRYLKALEAWKRASALGDTESYYRIGLLYARGEGVVPSLPDAVTWYRRAAEAGHTEAQYQLGLIYLNGSNGGVGDHWFKVASLQDSEAAQRTLNMLFPNGITVDRDLGEAKRWIWAAAVAGKVEAQAVLGELYRSGLGVAQDYQEAHHWYWLAAQQGVPSAQFAMGDLYYQGLGVDVDHRLAADWYEKGAKNCDAKSQVALASMYRAGQGKRISQREAGRLFVQAAEQGEARGLYQAALMYLKGEGLPENIDRAETYLRRSAKQSYLPAIIALAQFYAHGNGIEPDLREAAVWYLKAAELGDAQSQFIIGRLYATGSGVPSNLRESAKWFLRAAEHGHPTAAHNIATYYAKGSGVERDRAKSVEWYQVAAVAGLAASQVQLGKMYSDGDGVPRDRKLAADWLEKAVQSGDPEAKTALAMLHLQDDGEAHDPSRAEELLKQAAEGGHVAAAMQLGHLYSGKYAVEAKSGDAVRWYTKAAEGGTIEAQHTLGMLYLSGRGVQKNLRAAAGWIERAAQQGHALSQFQLAVFYCTAQGVPQDLARAVTWYEQAAERGHALAQYNLAVMLSKGQGCEADEARAASWFKKAAEQGVDQAKRALADLHRASHPPALDKRPAESSLGKSQSAEPTPQHCGSPADHAIAGTVSPSNQRSSNEVLHRYSPDMDATPASAREVSLEDGAPERERGLPKVITRVPSPEDTSNTVSTPIVRRAAAENSLPQPPVRREVSFENNASRAPLKHSAPSSASAWSGVTTEQSSELELETQTPAPIHVHAHSPIGRDTAALAAMSDLDATTSASTLPGVPPSIEGIDGAVRRSASIARSDEAIWPNLATRSFSPADERLVPGPTDHHGTQKASERSPPPADILSGSKSSTEADGRTRISAQSRVLNTPVTDIRPADPAAVPERVGATRRSRSDEQSIEISLRALSRLGRRAATLKEFELKEVELRRSKNIPPNQPVDAPVACAPDQVDTRKPPLNTTRATSSFLVHSAPDKASGRKDQEAKDQDTPVQLMTEIRDRLRPTELSDPAMSPRSIAPQTDGKAVDHDQNELSQHTTRVTNLRDCPKPIVALRESLEPPRVGTHTVFKGLSRAATELKVHSQKSDMTSADFSQESTVSDILHLAALNSEPGLTATRLPADQKALGSTYSDLMSDSQAQASTVAPNLSNVGRQSIPVKVTYEARSNVGQIGLDKVSSSDAKNLRGQRQSTEVEKAVGEFDASPVASPNRMRLGQIPKTAGEPLIVESLQEQINQETSRPNLCDLPEDRQTPALQARANTRRSSDRSQLDSPIDQFLEDLTRQLDDINLRSRRPIKQ